MDKNNEEPEVTPVKMRKIRKIIVDAAPHIKRRTKCQKCPMMFAPGDVDGIYLHWEGEHREEGEDNPFPFPSPSS